MADPNKLKRKRKRAAKRAYQPPATPGEYTVGARVFPTAHPYVTNEDGGRSNVRLTTVGFGDQTYVIPTMVGGKQLEGTAPVDTAREMGLQHYPSFDTLLAALEWAQKMHGRIDSEGRLTDGKESR